MSDTAATTENRPGQLGAAWRKMRTMTGVYYAMMSEYRAEIFLWAMAGVLPLLLMGVWMKVAESGRTPLTSIEFARYFFCVFVVGQFTTVWVVYEFDEDVNQGRLSPYLLQPLDPVWRYLTNHAGERLTRMPFVVIFVAVFFTLYPAAAWMPSWKSLGHTAIALTLAFTLRFCMQYTVAMLAFWTERASSLEQFTYLMFSLLGGRVAPLAVYPETIRELAMWLPFPHIVDLPASLLIGKETNPWPRFGVMLAWIAVLGVLNRVLWWRGLRRYSGMGA